MKSVTTRTFAGLACALALCAGAASANTYTFNTSDTGWVTTDGTSNGSDPLNNYLAGYCSAIDCTVSPTQEYRNFFQFDTGGLQGNVVSAILRINLHQVNTVQSPLMNYVLTSLAGTSFSSLGTGTLYGSLGTGLGNANQWVDISLNAASFAAIASGHFGLSGRVDGLDPSSSSSEYLFGYSGQDGLPQLLVSTAPVPEPETWALLLTGAVAVVARRKYGKAKQR